jgi:hypothetical protein
VKGPATGYAITMPRKEERLKKPIPDAVKK